MKQKKCFAIVSVILLMTIFCSGIGLNCLAYDNVMDRNYTYDKNADDVYIPDAYTFYQTISLVDNSGVAASNPSDFYVGNNGEFFIVDSDNSRVMIYDSNFKYETSIAQVKDAKGKVYSFSKPKGIYVYQNGDILLADTGNNRILKFDRKGNLLLDIQSPKLTSVTGNTAFIPMKVDCDSIGRIYVIAQNNNNGFIQLDDKGQFQTYIGAPTVKTDPINLLWRKISTKSQRQSLVNFEPTEYSNIYIDSSDFVWGTISNLSIGSSSGSITATSGQNPVKKLNSTGGDILNRSSTIGSIGVIGDEMFSDDEQESKFVDVAVYQDGIYSCLDSTRGHIFTYDSYGNLMYVFGNLYSDKKYGMHTPVAISYVGKNIIVLDQNKAKLFVYTPTTYGKLVLNAIGEQYEGNFEKANALWTEVANDNSNFNYAFVGLGKAKYSEKNYAAAMENYKYAGDVADYAKAFENMRKIVLQKYFPIFFVLFIILIIVLIIRSIVKRFLRYYRGA